MNRDDIIRMAREAGLTFVTEFGVASAPLEWIERFAALIAAAEREACARLCERLPDLEDGWKTNLPGDCAAAIRARSNP